MNLTVLNAYNQYDSTILNSLSNFRFPPSCDICYSHYEWSRNLSIILALGTWWCESIRALIRYNVRSRHTHTRIYFRWCDVARSHCSIRYDKMRSDEIVQIEFPIGSRSDPIITRPRLVTLKPCMCLCRYVHILR